MLQLKISSSRWFDEAREEFVIYPATSLKLEHSLISVQRWEAKWHKSFLNAKELTQEEVMDYVRCMSLDQNVDPSVFARLTSADVEKIKAYIADPMSATTFSSYQKNTPSRQIITAEIIYYWMTSFNIPFECAKWHLNQLLTLIRVCGIKGNPGGKIKGNSRELGKQRAALNKARRAKNGSLG